MGVIDIPVAKGTDAGMPRLKVFIFFVPPAVLADGDTGLGAGDFIFMGGGTNTVLTCTGLVVGVRGGVVAVEELWGMKVAICLGAGALEAGEFPNLGFSEGTCGGFGLNCLKDIELVIIGIAPTFVCCEVTFPWDW